MATINKKLPRGVKRIIYFVRLAQPAGPGHRTTEPARSEALAPQLGGVTPQVVITHVQYDGKVGRVESDEYIEIQNLGPTPIDLSGWRVSAGTIGEDFRFPTLTIIQSQQAFRVYTNEIHPETGGFSFGSKRAVWNNQGDVGLLFDRSGAEVSRWAYGRKAQILA